MTGDFGKFINEKRLGRASDGSDILLKDIAQAMGTTATYLSDIIKGRRNPPEMSMLLKIADVLRLTDEERAEMFDLAGRERNEQRRIFLSTLWTRTFRMFVLLSAKPAIKSSVMTSGSVFWRKSKRKDKYDQRSISQLPCPSNV